MNTSFVSAGRQKNFVLGGIAAIFVFGFFPAVSIGSPFLDDAKDSATLWGMEYGMEYGMVLFILVIAAFVLLAMSKTLSEKGEGHNTPIRLSQEHIALGVVGILGLFSLLLVYAGIEVHQASSSLGGVIKVSLSIGFYLVILATAFTLASIFAFHFVDKTSDQLKEATEKAVKNMESAIASQNTTPPKEAPVQEAETKATEEGAEEVKKEAKPARRPRASAKKTEKSAQ